MGTSFSFSKLFMVFAIFLFSIGLVSAQVDHFNVTTNLTGNATVDQPFELYVVAVLLNGNPSPFDGNCDGPGSSNLTSNVSGIVQLIQVGNESLFPPPGTNLTNWDTGGAGNATTTLVPIQAGSITVNVNSTCTGGDIDPDGIGGVIDLNVSPVVIPPSTGHLNGTVTNASDGSPIANANVSFNGAEQTFNMTNASGHYILYSLTAGSGFGMLINASDQGFQEQGHNGNISVVASQTTEYNFSLIAGGQGGQGPPPAGGDAFCDGGSNGNATIHGKVINSTGDGLENATIHMGPRFEGPGGPGGEPGQMPMGGCFGYTQTNSSGDYHVTGFLAGIYDVFLEPPQDSDYSNAKDTANLSTNTTNSSINFTLGTGGSIRVNVSESGNPVVGANVFAFVPFIPQPGQAPPEDKGSFAFGMTNGSGEAKLGGLTNGTYTVRVEPFGTSFASTEAQGITVSENTTFINITLSTAGSIAGNVNLTDGSPVEGAFINAFVPFGPGFDGGTGGGGGFGFAVTNSSGGYTISGLPNGTYEMDVNPPFDSTLSREFRRGVNVTEGNTNPQNFLLSAGSALTGNVNASNGAPIANAFINAFIPSKTPFSPPTAFGFASTNSTGGYSIFGLTAGTYEVRVEPPFNSAYASASANGVVMVDGQNASRNFTLSSGGSISGVVTGSSGVGFAFVNAFIPSTDPHSPPSSFGWAQTNSSGHYNVTGLQAGNYEVFIEPPFGSSFTTGQGQANVTEGADASLNFSLGSGGSLVGKIVDANNNSVSGAFIDAFSETVHSFGFSGTKPDGTFTISGLAPATDYVLFVHPPAGSTKGKTTQSGVSVTSGATTDIGTIALVSATGGIDGYINYSNGTPITTARVFAWSPSSFSFGDSAVNSSGYYNISGLSAGEYDVFADLGLPGLPNQFVPNLTVSTTVISQNFTLNTGSLVTINGTINTTANVSIANVDVGVFNETSHAGAHNQTNGSGYYQMTVPAGTYHLNAFHPDYLPMFVETVDISSSTTYDINLTALSSLTTFTLSGNVTVSGTATSGLTVIAVDTTNSTSSRTSITGSAGNYTINGLLPSTYNVTAISGANSNSTSVSVTANVTQNLAITS